MIRSGLAEHVHHAVLDLQRGELAVIDLAVKGVGEHGEGLVQPEDARPVDLLGAEVKLLGSFRLELDQWRQRPGDQA